MIKSYQQIIGTPVVRHSDGELLALINDVIINPDTGKIEAFWVKPATIPVSNAVLKSDAITDWKKKVYIQSENEIVEAEDVIRISEILSKNTYFIGNTVKNEAGDFIGTVYDLDFDTEKLYLRQIYTEKSFLIFSFSKRIFNSDSILKALPEYILVKDKQDIKEKVGETAFIKRKPLLDV